MRFLFYHLPETEDEAVLVSDVMLSREVDLSIMLEESDFTGSWQIYSLFHDGDNLTYETPDDVQPNECYLTNLGDGAFEALLPFKSLSAAEAFSDTYRAHLTKLESMWEGEDDE